MKKSLILIAQSVAFVGLPASFLAQSTHIAGPISKNSFYVWLNQSHFDNAPILIPLIIASILVSIAWIIVHHLHDDHSLDSLLLLPPGAIQRETAERIRRKSSSRAPKTVAIGF